MSDKPREWNKSWSNCESHAHDNPGHWDSDNGDKSGTVCELCYRWNAFEEIDAENDKLLTEVMSLRLQKDPDIVDGVKDVTIAALKNTETRVRADRDKIREERDTLLKENENLKAELKLTQNRLWDATVFLDTTKEKLSGIDAQRKRFALRISDLEKERDTLKAKLAALDRDPADDWKRIQDAERKLAEVEAEATSLKDQLAWSIKNENMYKAETHTALINLERMREQLSDCGALYEGAKDTFKELNREREAAKVMREALSAAVEVMQFAYMNAPEQPIEIAQSLAAIAKADEIRGNE